MRMLGQIAGSFGVVSDLSPISGSSLKGIEIVSRGEGFQTLENSSTSRRRPA